MNYSKHFELFACFENYLHVWLDEKKCLLEVQIVFPIVWLNTFCMANTYELYAHFQTISKTIELPQTVWEFSPYSLISFLGVYLVRSFVWTHYVRFAS